MSIALLYGNPDDVGDTVQMSIRRCNSCGHIFNQAFQQHHADSIYGNPLYTIRQTKSASVAKSLSELCVLFQKEFAERAGFNHALEVGAGNADFGNLISNLFSCIYLIDPSLVLDDSSAPAKNVKMVKAAFNRETRQKYTAGKKFDVIIARHVIEHVINPKGFISELLYCLANDGVLYIEMPNSNISWKNKNFLDIFNDHVQYFSINSFILLCLKLKLEVQKIVHYYNHQHIGFFLTRQNNNLIATIKQKQLFLDQLKAYSERQLPYAVWGMGAQGIALLDMISGTQMTRPSHLFDSDPKKVGMFTGKKGFPAIEAPNKEILRTLHAVVITPSLHREEINKYLKNQQFTGRVILV